MKDTEVSESIMTGLNEALAHTQGKLPNVRKCKITISNSVESTINIKESEWYQKMKNEITPGSTLKRYRKRREISITELAKRSEVTEQNLLDMENEIKLIDKETANKLAVIFQTSPERFM